MFERWKWLVAVNTWKASYPVPEFWALRQQRKEWSDWRMSLWLVNKASFDWRDLCRDLLLTFQSWKVRDRKTWNRIKINSLRLRKLVKYLGGNLFKWVLNKNFNVFHPESKIDARRGWSQRTWEISYFAIFWDFFGQALNNTSRHFAFSEVAHARHYSSILDTALAYSQHCLHRNDRFAIWFGLYRIKVIYARNEREQVQCN